MLYVHVFRAAPSGYYLSPARVFDVTCSLMYVLICDNPGLDVSLVFPRIAPSCGWLEIDTAGRRCGGPLHVQVIQ